VPDWYADQSDVIVPCTCTATYVTFSAKFLFIGANWVEWPSIWLLSAQLYQVPSRIIMDRCHTNHKIHHSLTSRKVTHLQCLAVNTCPSTNKMFVNINCLVIVLNRNAPSLWIQQIARINDDFDEDRIILQVEAFTLVLQHFLFNKQRTATSDVHRHCWLLEAGTCWIWPEHVWQVSSVVLLVDQH